MSRSGTTPRLHCPSCGAALVNTTLRHTSYWDVVAEAAVKAGMPHRDAQAQIGEPLSAPIAGPIDAPLHCKHCGWHLVTLEAWRALTPFRQGYALYMQASWPTSEIAGQKNPYAEDTPEGTAFRQGEQRAMIDVQDGEE